MDQNNLNLNNKKLKIAVVGGGPGGLYFSILTKKALPYAEINVYERNKPDDSFGFGVVFSDETLAEFLKRDMASYELIRSNFAYWDDIIIARDGEQVSIAGNGFCGCSRKTLLKLLHQRCEEEGVKLHFETAIDDLSTLADTDVILAADGIGSQIRSQYEEAFGTEIQLKSNRFVWMGSTKPLAAFTYFYRNTPHGLIAAHTYQYETGMSTWIFECSEETWQKHGFEINNEADTVAKLETIFKDELDGHGLITNKSLWRQFPHVTNKNWYHKNIVLLGDAKATAHYSIGSGTKLAMDSAIGLSDAVVAHPDDMQKAFKLYDTKRRQTVEMIQHAALVSLDWFENMDRNNQQTFYQFAFGCMTRSKKVTFENLRLRDASFTDLVLKEFNSKQKNESPSPAFTTFNIGEMMVNNRIVMAPMMQYAAEDGCVKPWHLVHYGSRATQGVGLIITEMTLVAPSIQTKAGRAGIYNEQQIEAWKKITDFVHENSQTKIAIQLGHPGRKGIKKPWENDRFFDEKIYSASSIAFDENSPSPLEMTTSDMSMVIEQFKQATINARLAGFDMIELQAHHGFLFASFLSPLTNIRQDEFGGSVENRLKFPLEVFKAMREVFPKEKPIGVRISATDWAEGGITLTDSIEIAKAFKSAGAAIISVSAGNTVSDEQPKYGRMYQVPFSDAIRDEAHVSTITAGQITDIDQINTIILNGKADLVALGKPLLLDGFVRHAQAYEGVVAEDVPNAYQNAIKSLYQQQQGEKKQMESMKKALKPVSNERK